MERIFFFSVRHVILSVYCILPHSSYCILYFPFHAFILTQIVHQSLRDCQATMEENLGVLLVRVSKMFV